MKALSLMQSNLARGLRMTKDTSKAAVTEWDIVVREVKHHRERFIARLQRHLVVDGECVIWTGACRGGRTGPGYPTMNFNVGKNKRRCVDVHRIFLMLMLCRPIAPKMEAGHYFCMNTRCVRHVQEETRLENLKELNGRQKATDSCPF
jgi:hypothetical protein